MNWLLLMTIAAAAGVTGNTKVKNWVSFGDSYTDESRLRYFIANDGSAPPVGWVDPGSNTTATGGRSWPRYVSQYTGVKLFNYAVSGAVCSNELTPRWFDQIHANFPSVLEYEVPAFIADFKHLNISLSESVISLWIGTNDLGGDALISHSQKRGETIVSFTSCVFDVLKKLYDFGARKFVLQNIAPLEYAPLYTDLEHGGSPGPNRFWKGRGDNATDTMVRMKDEVFTVNEIWKWRTPVEVQKRLRGAEITLFDSYALLSEIYHNPSQYLNGSLPLNVTGYNDHCDANWNNCFQYRIGDRDSFLWYDELHPSEQVDRIIAKEISSVIKGRSKYAEAWK